MLSPEEIAALKRNLLLWERGAELSYDRVVAQRDDEVASAVDARFLALAIRNVLRAAVWARNHSEGEAMAAIGKAISEFDSAVPRAREVRDIIEHFDEYERGRGDLQKNGSMKSPLEYTARFEEEYLLALADTHKLDARSAKEATVRLAEAVLGILDGYGAPT